MNSRNGDRLLSGSGTWFKGAALLAATGVALSWICCFVPLSLASAGAAAALLGWELEAYRPYLVGLALLFLAVSFYLSYRRQRRCNDQQSCAVPRSRRRERIILWMVAVVVLVLLALPYWISWWIYWTL